MNKTEKKVIELLIENPSFTSIELAEKIGVTKRTIESHLNHYKKRR
ncbi:MAG: winged helix-turn-helix domain-containing protein [Anaerococcus hydrogenalis]|nr:winged helix-turn-helix domain-containing protein [Anaerococcus hydrogenalis]MDU2583525.1 winged helix-turn-helix domain-containing protein [Anaerococcus hydrogenalis]